MYSKISRQSIFGKVGSCFKTTENIVLFVGTSSAEVKENRNFGNLEDHSTECQSLFYSDSSRSGSSGLKRKRPLEEDNNGHMCQLRLIYKKLSWSDAPKNALVQLNELRPGLQYRMVSQTGPVHAPVFSIAVEVNGLTFEGTGPTKKKAKMRAAELALKSFVQFPNAPQAHLAMGNISNPSADFTSDQADFPDTLFKEFESSPCSDSDLLSSELLRHGRLLRHTLDLMVQAQQRLGGIDRGFARRGWAADGGLLLQIGSLEVLHLRSMNG